ncbi:MAG: BlaI/MecI/CopY family transcriptional regulator [Ruminococcaceae bacterium]|nr:BlaI/MecI/CopY family transcriptional regulator [Oscillospiraceae bacterium]
MNKINLSEGEWKIMKLLWEKAPLTTAQMVSALEPETGWTKTTVFVMLKRLIAKGAVEMDESGKFNTYRPTVSRSAVSESETESFISRVYDGSIGLMFSALAGSRSLSDDEINQLRSILDDAEKKNGEER